MKSLGHLECYFSDVLYPRLSSYGLEDDLIMSVCNDIRNRLLSIISRWDNIKFKRTLLVTCVEEASFYQPPVHLEKRCLVVLAIRNSIIEDLSSTDEAARNLGLSKSVISDAEIRKITSEAIQFFDALNINEYANSDTTPENDVYGLLESKYPTAWNVLSHLGEAVFENKKYSILQKNDSLSKSKNTPLNKVIEFDQSMKNSTVVLSGMDPNFDPHLLHVLEAIKNGLPNFFSDSFKSITRNPDKLFNLFENVLMQGASVVTSNFYISCHYVSCRKTFIRPGHTSKDFIENLKNKNGLTKTHLSALRDILSNFT